MKFGSVMTFLWVFWQCEHFQLLEARLKFGADHTDKEKNFWRETLWSDETKVVWTQHQTYCQDRVSGAAGKWSEMIICPSRTSGQAKTNLTSPILSRGCSVWSHSQKTFKNFITEPNFMNLLWQSFSPRNMRAVEIIFTTFRLIINIRDSEH